MKLGELERLAKEAGETTMSWGAFHNAATPSTILNLIGLLREMAGALDVYAPMSEAMSRPARDALAKYKEIAG